MAGNDWQRLAVAIEARMAEMNIDQADLSRLSELSPPTVKGLVDGNTRGDPRTKTLRKLEDGLGWRRGSAADILAGGEPVAEVAQTGGNSTLQQPPSNVDILVELARMRADMAESERRIERMFERYMKGAGSSDDDERDGGAVGIRSERRGG